jgi:hypothetical protein
MRSVEGKMQSVSQLHRAARKYAAAGIAIFPCLPNAKEPATEHSFKEATTDLAQIDAWWSERPDLNIALCPDDAGWLVVDTDPPVGEESWAKLIDEAGWPEIDTYTVETPRGGLHRYFTGSGPTSASKLGEKIDTRGRGGYVLVPPSIVNGRPYRARQNQQSIQAAPGFIASRLAQSRDHVAAAGVALDQPGSVERARSLLREYVRRGHLAVEGRGGDTRTYEVAAEVLSLGLSADKALEIIFDTWNPYCDPPWDEADLRVKIENAASYAQNEPGAWAVGSAQDVFGAALDQLPASVRDRRSRFHPEDEDEQELGKDPVWIIKDLLQEASTAMLVGPTQSYKSFIALNIALGIASGVECFGTAPLTGPVFYCALEGKTNLKRARRRAWKIAHQVDKIPNFFVMTAPMVALEEECQEFGEQIAAKCKGGPPPRLIVIDTLAKSMAGLNENDARDAGRFIRFCDSLVEAFGCTVVAIHHTGKDDGRGGRGSSAFHAGFDSVIEVKASRPTKALEVRVVKHKDGEEPDTPWTFVGRVIGPSLVFFPTTPHEHASLTKTEDPYEPRKIGRKLQELKAVDVEHGVPTNVLASAMYEGVENESTEDRAAHCATIARKLGGLSKTRLAAYCSATTKGILWHLTAAE